MPYHSFTEVSVRKSGANRLINEKDIGVRVPRFWVNFRAVFIIYSARSLSEKSKIKSSELFYDDGALMKANLVQRRAQRQKSHQVHHWSKKSRRLCLDHSCFQRNRRRDGGLRYRCIRCIRCMEICR
jgi:hypothetical protein